MSSHTEYIPGGVQYLESLQLGQKGKRDHGDLVPGYVQFYQPIEMHVLIRKTCNLVTMEEEQQQQTSMD